MPRVDRRVQGMNNMKGHFSTKDATNLSMGKRKMPWNYRAEYFKKQSIIQVSGAKVGYMLSYNLTKQSKALTDGELFKTVF